MPNFRCLDWEHASHFINTIHYDFTILTEAATKSRLELIKEKALAFLEDLKCKAEEAYKDMEKWLGSTFLAEISW